jgi:hypothetical protein
MRVHTKVEFYQCEVDPKYTIGRVTETFTVNWWDKLFGWKDEVVCREFRTNNGLVWYKLPEFTRFSPPSWADEYQILRLLEKGFDENREREAYIKASERLME